MATSDSSICAGAAKALMAAGGTTQMMRISERLGLADLDQVEARGADVWDLDQWPRLAEGSTGDNPEWIIGDEYGVETCSVVGPDCEAPAGYLGAGGAVVRGTEAATERCDSCGEAVCTACLSERDRHPYRPADDGVAVDVPGASGSGAADLAGPDPPAAAGRP